MIAMLRTAAVACALTAVIGSSLPGEAAAQGRGKQAGAQALVGLSVEVKAQIRDFYAAREAVHPEALPPGIRRNLARGRPLPPGIAKKSAPDALVSTLHLPGGFTLMEVGADVLLVEVATWVIHDVLTDLIR